MFIDTGTERKPSSVGAACFPSGFGRARHAAPTELGISTTKPNFHKHGAPNGATERCRTQGGCVSALPGGPL